ncbi:carbohydrate esterase family 4 protein [Mycena leptocephala]|nr:carbohydrate esterase family 4 protein [Mycena leptocephala]
MLFGTFTFLLTPILSLAQRPVELASTRKAVLYSSCTVPNTVALTFDDGPYLYMYGTNISDILTSMGAKGTFFVNGNNYECIYGTKVAERLQYVYNSGHQICSHTWSHPDLTTLSEIEIALMKILGVATPFLRPPYGSYNNLVREVAFQQNKSLVLWDMDSEDSLNATIQESEGYYDTAISSNVSTLLALNHETVGKDHPAPRYAVDALQAANYTLVTVAECLGLQPYTFVGPLGQRDASRSLPSAGLDFLTSVDRLHGSAQTTELFWPMSEI